jgi:hypothetical protein
LSEDAFRRLATLRSSGMSLSLKLDSYGLKLDLNSLGDPLADGDDDTLSRIFVLFSMLARSLGFGVASLPIALHVCANSASGLDFESNCCCFGGEEEREREIKTLSLF